MDRWPHQIQGVADVKAALLRGCSRVLLTSPTGGGKSVMMTDLAEWYLDNDKRVSVYTNRKLLVEQLHRVFSKAGITHGIRAAGNVPEPEEALQISSIQTEHSRVVQRELTNLHNADLVLVDEAHLFNNEMANRIMDAHSESGAMVVGVTATPLDLGGIYHELVQAGTNSDLRKCGALVPAFHYGPDEPDLRHIGKVNLGEDLTEKQNVKAIMTHGVFGRVYDSWKRLNPGQAPTILFAPGVPESVWFAEQFWKEGVPSAHIDGEEVWINGVTKRSTPELRAQILGDSKCSRVRVLCNRFCLREGVDAPWLAHGVFATVFGSLQSYLQAGGRLLRSYPELLHVTIQDHGGNWHRHGSLNADRRWELGDTARIVAGRRVERLRGNPGDTPDAAPREPIRCPQCGMILAKWKCPCGFVIEPRKKSRPVVQADGSLKQMWGDIFKPRETKRLPDTAMLWTKMYFRARNSKKRMTFAAALGLFFHENGYYPPMDSRGLPRSTDDLYRAVVDVPPEQLHTGETQ